MRANDSDNRFCVPTGTRWMAAGLVAVLLSACVTATAQEVEGEPMPPFAKVKEVLARHFSASDIAAEDLISQSDVVPVFKLLQMIGWEVEDAREITIRVLPDGNFLVRQFKSKAGKKFMRQVANYPQAYDRMDQLSHLPHGKQTIRDLIRGPDGYKMIQYMTMTPGGKNMNSMLSQTPTGEDFTRPTGRIYTPRELVEQLAASYDAEVKRREQGETSPAASTAFSQ